MERTRDVRRALGTRRTLKNVSIGWIVGVVVSFVPVLLVIAPLIAGGVAGYLERAGVRGGAVVGAMTGFALAAFSAILAALLLFVNLGVVPFEGYPRIAIVLSLLWGGIAAAGVTIVAAIGGALGGIVESDRSRRSDAPVDTRRNRIRRTSILAAAIGLVAGAVTFAAVALAVTAALDPYVWPSAIVGLPAGVVAGVAVLVVGFHYLSARLEARAERGGGG